MPLVNIARSGPDLRKKSEYCNKASYTSFLASQCMFCFLLFFLSQMFSVACDNV